MDPAAYASMKAQEDGHWWFVARRTIIENLIRTHVSLPEDARILEAGCGTGGNLELLAQFGALDAMEYDADARSVSAARGLARIESGYLPDTIGFGDTQYHLVALLDVLEHVDADEASLRALAGRLAPDGRILLTVPAVPQLWSYHDELHHHKRRYTHEQLVAVAEASGLEVQASGYFNSLLLPLAMVQRVAHKLAGRKVPLDARPAPWLNRVLRSVFGAERHLLNRMRFPLGLSLYAVLSVREPVGMTASRTAA